MSYLRLVDDLNVTHCSLLKGKTKLTPIKPHTVPRLELCAATIAINQDQIMRRELQLPYNLQPSTFWTDSTIIPRYIRNESSVYHTFVANRVQQIRNGSDISQWRYVPSNQNPADDPSRGMTIKNFLECERWKSGPDFLWQPEINWPEKPSFLEPVLADPEIKKKTNIASSCFANVNEQTNFFDDLICRFSGWYMLLCILARVLRYKKRFLNFMNKTAKTGASESGLLMTAEISEAERKAASAAPTAKILRRRTQKLVA